MVTLRVMVDSFLERSPRGIARYTEELTRALIATAPRDCTVQGIVSAVPPEEVDSLREVLPGLESVVRLPFGRRELRTAWQHRLTARPLGGMVHAPSLFAPLARHDRIRNPGEQTVVTIHDAAAWLYPEENLQSAWTRQMGKRAEKHADAIVVPSHAVAADLEERLQIGDRIRVIGGAPSSALRLPEDPESVITRLGLPPEFLLTIGTLSPRKGLEDLLEAAASSAFPDIPLVVVGPEHWGDRSMTQAVFRSGAPQGRVHLMSPLPDDELATVIDRAAAMVVPSRHEGFGLTAVEALHFGTPLIHSDAPALVEVVAGAGVEVARADGAEYPQRLAEAVASTLADRRLMQDLAIAGRDRAAAFSWKDSAERVWQLHAEL